MRRFLDNMRMGLRAMLQRPFRTFLILQGVIWGTAVAIMPPAIIEGSRQAMIRRASGVGTDRVVLTAETLETSGALTLEDNRFLLERFGDDLKAAAPMTARRARFRMGDRTAEGWVVGTTPQEPIARTLEISWGTWFEEGSRQAVLEPGLAADLGIAGGAPAGTPLDIEFLEKQVPGEKAKQGDASEEEAPAHAPQATLSGMVPVGVLAPLPRERTEVDDFGMKRKHFLSGVASEMLTNMGVVAGVEAWRDKGRTAHIPIERWPIENDPVDMIVLKSHPERVVRLIEEIRQEMSTRGRAVLVRWNLLAPVLLEGKADKYIRLRYATFLLCLIMGAVVISNVMLFNVLENYREIAIRRVEGATRMDIVVMYLTQSGLFALVGGLLGLPVGMAVARVRIMLAPSASMGLIFPWDSAAWALACTLAAGILAGVLPARRAAGLDPVKALRNE